jgi:CheY-like chemotaxis protein
VLLVDDDAAFRKVYAGLLRDSGYEVSEAADREGARKALEGEPPEVVLLDLMLPPDGTVEAGLQQLEQTLARVPGAKVVGSPARATPGQLSRR